MVKTKEALSVLLNTAEKFTAAYADDQKISVGEGFGLALQATKLISIFKDLPEIKAELKDLDAAGLVDLTAQFKAEFDIANDELEAKIEDGVTVLSQLASVILYKD